MNLVEFKNFSLSDENNSLILKNINLPIKENEFIALIGSSGAGKSSLLKSLMNIQNENLQKSGEILWHKMANFGAILQNPASCFDSVFRISYHFKESFLAKNLKPDTDKFKSLLAEVGLDESVLRAYPFELSGGQLQRIMIALALCCPINLLIGDEPNSDLDSLGEKELFELIFKLKEKYHFAFLLTTHSLELAKKADKIIILDKGQIVEKGNFQTLFTKPQSSKTKAFINAHNFLQEQDFTPQSSNKNTPLLEAENICLSYKQGGFFARTKPKLVLDGLSLKIYEGVNLGIVGKNGSGKSSLVRVLLGLEKASSANLNLQGFQKDDKAYKQKLAVIFQNPPASLNPAFSAKDAICEPLWNLKLDKKEQNKRLNELAKALELEGLDKKCAFFSGGELQRIALARALITRPKLLILDEALSNLDVLLQVSIIRLLKKLQNEFKLTFLCISHQQNILNALCDELFELKNGKLLAIKK